MSQPPPPDDTTEARPDNSDPGGPDSDDADRHAELRERLRLRNAASEANYRTKSGDRL